MCDDASFDEEIKKLEIKKGIEENLTTFRV